MHSASDQYSCTEISNHFECVRWLHGIELNHVIDFILTCTIRRGKLQVAKFAATHCENLLDQKLAQMVSDVDVADYQIKHFATLAQSRPMILAP